MDFLTVELTGEQATELETEIFYECEREIENELITELFEASIGIEECEKRLIIGKSIYMAENPVKGYWWKESIDRLLFHNPPYSYTVVCKNCGRMSAYIKPEKDFDGCIHCNK